MKRLRRKVDKFLEDWKKSEVKYPLIIKGAYVKIGLNQEKPYKTRA